jgi:hypothetical protein
LPSWFFPSRGFSGNGLLRLGSFSYMEPRELQIVDS